MNVYEAAVKRIKFIFDEFDNVCVSFSGGKDSGVMLNLAMVEARKRGRRITCMHLDYEAQYEATTEYVDRVLSESLDALDVYRVCAPFKVTTCTSMHQSFWKPWEKELEDIWVRPLPKICSTQVQFPFFKEEMWDYEFQEKFGLWIHEKSSATKTAILVGIRTQESLNRWRAIHSDRNTNKYKGLEYSKRMDTNVFNFYPIYDWSTEDIWVANARFGWDYNRLYDLFYLAGVSIHDMRVASPFLSTAAESLKLYRVIEPHTWGKLISRVNGVNFTGIYGGTTAMGWKTINKPANYTWKDYCLFLLSTLPVNAQSNYRDKLETSMQFWSDKGGLLDEETIEELKRDNVSFEVVEHNYNSTKKAVRLAYQDDTNVSNFAAIPSWKRMCVCILKNDHLCKYMGFALNKHEMKKRRLAIEHYQNIL